MKLRILVMLVLAVMLAACTQQIVNKAMSKNVNFGVRLDPKTMPTPSVNILSKPQGANRSGKQNGYVGFGRGEQGFMVFSIKNQDPSDTCATGADWVITDLKLSGSGSTTTEKGSNFGLRQPDWLALAFPGVDENGIMFPKATGPQEVTMLPVYNANRTKEEVNVFYEVTVKSCTSPPTTVKTDPMVGNGGKN